MPSYPSLDYHKSFFENASYGILLYDLQEERIVECNRKARHLLPVEGTEFSSANSEFLQLSPEFQPNGLLSSDQLKVYLQTIKEEGHFEFQWLFRQPQLRPILTHIHGSLIEEQEQQLVAFSVRDISENQQRIDSFQQIFKTSDLANSQESLNTLLRSIAWEFQLDAIILAQCAEGELESPSVISAILQGEIVHEFPYHLKDGPCQEVRQRRNMVIYNGNLQASYPQLPPELGSESYLGIPMFNPRGEIIAYLSALKKGRFYKLPQLIEIIDEYAQWACMQIERLEYDQEVQQKNERLVQYINTNLQLENFRYLASHDLKEPLRSLISFSQLLHLKARHKLDTDELEYLNYISQAGKCIESMVNDLLFYSQVDSLKPQMRQCSLTRIIDQAVQRMEEQHPGRHFQVAREDLPRTIKGDAKKLVLLFYNLISNACKFAHPEKMPKISIRATELDGNLQISITDNGIGIEDQYYERVFLLFKKLHNRQGMTGNGVGLSICRKIVEQHQGEIWVNSTPGFGSTFHFTLPRAESEHILTSKRNRRPALRKVSLSATH